MASESRWRLASRGAIAQALEGVADKSDEKAVRKALFDAYPFGQREMLPYKMWLSEQKKALERLGFGGAKTKAKPLEVSIGLGTRWGKPLWLHARCGWCGSTACLVCGAAERRAVEAAKDATFLALRTAAKEGDAVALAALHDRLEELLGQEYRRSE